MEINKDKILNELKNLAKYNLKRAKEALGTTRGHVTDTELKAEGKYDTRSIEAGYLAGAQEKRVNELEHEIALLDEINLSHSNQNISVGSLAEIELNQNSRLYFISSTSGGTILKIDNHPILVISAFSPIGSASIGLAANDSFEVERPGEIREYEIKKIW